MATRNNIHVLLQGLLQLLAAAAFICGAAACKKITGCVTTGDSNEYLVKLPVRLYPAKDSFNVGDTLWVEQIFPDQVRDERNGLSLDFRPLPFRIRISPSNLLDSYDFSIKQQFAAETGTLERAGLGSLQIGYEHSQDTFRFKGYLIMLHPGLFKLAFLPIHQPEKADFSKCAAEYLDLRTSVNGNAENNYHMLQYSTDTTLHHSSKEEFDKAGNYCFYVR